MQLMHHHTSKTFVPKQMSKEPCNPKSLFLISAELVAENLIYVDTFVTIPEIVGETIFEVAHSTGQFENHGCSTCLEPFTSAYGRVILECLAVRGSGELVREFGPELRQFLHLTECDMSDCGIQDDDDILIHIGTSLHSLEVLILADNNLSDAGIQRMTASSRVMSKGLQRLNHLDLSGNRDVTDKVCMYLRTFRNLTRLNLSQCRITEVGKYSLRKHLSLTPKEPSDPVQAIVVTNRGWAAPVILNWIDKCSTRRPIKSFFYSKKEVATPDVKSRSSLIFVRDEQAGVMQHHRGPGSKTPILKKEPIVGQSCQIKNGTNSIRESHRAHGILPNGGKGVLSDRNLLEYYSNKVRHARSSACSRPPPDYERLPNMNHRNPNQRIESVSSAAGLEGRSGEGWVNLNTKVNSKRKGVERGRTAKRRRVKLVGKKDEWDVIQEGNSLVHDSPLNAADVNGDSLLGKRTVAKGSKSVFDYLD